VYLFKYLHVGVCIQSGLCVWVEITFPKLSCTLADADDGDAATCHSHNSAAREIQFDVTAVAVALLLLLMSLARLIKY